MKSKAALVVVDAGGRLALRKLEAARALGVSDETFDRHVAGRVQCVRLGSIRLYPVSELQRFVEAEASLPLDDR